MPGQIPQISDRLLRHEASPQKPMLQKLSDPGTICHVGLPAWHVLDMGRIDQKNPERLFKKVVNRFPLDAGAFRRHLDHP